MTTTIEVRPAKSADAAAIEQVLLASYPSLMTQAYDFQILARALPLMTKANDRLLRGGTYYVAEAGGRIVGCGGWSLEEPGSNAIAPGTAHIRHFAVKADWVRRGVGKTLFERCEVDARRQGVRSLKCFASLNAVEFYNALGFEAQRAIEVAMASGISFPSMLMERLL